MVIDVARSGDRTVLAGVHSDDLRIHYSEQGANHTMQENRLRTYLDSWAGDGQDSLPIAVDAVGEGSGLADSLDQTYPDVERFKAGSVAATGTEYKDRWAEALGLLGDLLADRGAVGDRRLREEILAAARTVTFDERYLVSRGESGATVLEATAKTAVTDILDRSPDHLDAAAMAVWARDSKPSADTVDLDTAFAFEL